MLNSIFSIEMSNQMIRWQVASLQGIIMSNKLSCYVVVYTSWGHQPTVPLNILFSYPFEVCRHPNKFMFKSPRKRGIDLTENTSSWKILNPETPLAASTPKLQQAATTKQKATPFLSLGPLSAPKSHVSDWPGQVWPFRSLSFFTMGEKSRQPDSPKTGPFCQASEGGLHFGSESGVGVELEKNSAPNASALVTCSKTPSEQWRGESWVTKVKPSRSCWSPIKKRDPKAPPARLQRQCPHRIHADQESIWRWALLQLRKVLKVLSWWNQPVFPMKFASNEQANAIM